MNNKQANELIEKFLAKKLENPQHADTTDTLLQLADRLITVQKWRIVRTVVVGFFWLAALYLIVTL